VQDVREAAVVVQLAQVEGERPFIDRAKQAERPDADVRPVKAWRDRPLRISGVDPRDRPALRGQVTIEDLARGFADRRRARALEDDPA
jgi:hypothetical protein